MATPRISRLDTWARHEKKVIEVLVEALKLLQRSSQLADSEVKINRELYFCLLEANRELQKRRRGFNSPPNSEAKNPPYHGDKERAVREDKIPDFSWGFVDNLEPDPRRSARHFVIECKRLGNPPRHDWILNTNYVAHGIVRFLLPEHGYAKGERSAAMVGYVQSMDLANIFSDVNTAAVARSIAVLSTDTHGFQERGITILSHVTSRPFDVSPFTLWHLWIDLRHRYPVSRKRYRRTSKIGTKQASTDESTDQLQQVEPPSARSEHNGEEAVSPDPQLYPTPVRGVE